MKKNLKIVVWVFQLEIKHVVQRDFYDFRYFFQKQKIFVLSLIYFTLGLFKNNMMSNKKKFQPAVPVIAYWYVFGVDGYIFKYFGEHTFIRW